MLKEQHSKHNKHFNIIYPASTVQKLYSIFVTPVIVLAVIWVLIKTFSLFPGIPKVVDYEIVAKAFGYTFWRLLVAYVLALIASVPLALWANKSDTAERILLPTFDIIQSIPVLAFFPIVIAVFIQFGMYNGAAIFILFLAMLWNMVFSLIGGLRSIPADIKSAARVFGITKLSYLKKILLPASVPYLVTGSLLAWAQGWNIIIVAEVLHTYIPGGTASQELFGIGSMLVNAAAGSQQELFVAAIVAMVIGIGLINFFVWQKLLHYAERFKFE